MLTLSIQEPWASLIVAGIKPIENRTWWTKVRGQTLIHAGKKFDGDACMWLLNNWFKHGLPSTVEDLIRQKLARNFGPGGFGRGEIIGKADLVDCVTSHPSPFFFGPHGFVFANPHELPHVALRGQLGFFEVQWPA